MQFRTTGLLLLGAMALPAPGTAQTTPAPPAITRTVVAATKLPTVTDRLLHFKAEHHSSAGREEQRLGGRRHPLPDARIDRGRARWRGQNSQRRRGAVHRRRKDRGANGGQRRALGFPPLLPCSRCGLGSACRDGACRRERIVSHSESDPRPGAGGYDLSLTRVIFQARMPSNPPHHRSGAALYFTISGTGQSTVRQKQGDRAPEDNHEYESIQIRRAVAKTGAALTSRGGAFQKPAKREDEL
jgi:hypothetical protein